MEKMGLLSSKQADFWNCFLGVFSKCTNQEEQDSENELVLGQYFDIMGFADIGKCFRDNMPTCDKIVNDAIKSMSDADKKAYI